MSQLRCPDPSHGAARVLLKSTHDRHYECEASHRYFRREEGGREVLVDIISGRQIPLPEGGGAPGPGAGRPKLNFMVDVPRVTQALDFDQLSLEPGEWKVIARVDGRSTIEEIRLLAGMKAEETEEIVHRLLDSKLIEIRRFNRS